MDCANTYLIKVEKNNIYWCYLILPQYKMCCTSIKRHLYNAKQYHSRGGSCNSKEPCKLAAAPLQEKPVEVVAASLQRCSGHDWLGSNPSRMCWRDYIYILSWGHLKIQYAPNNLYKQSVYTCFEWLHLKVGQKKQQLPLWCCLQELCSYVAMLNVLMQWIVQCTLFDSFSSKAFMVLHTWKVMELKSEKTVAHFVTSAHPATCVHEVGITLRWSILESWRHFWTHNPWFWCPNGAGGVEVTVYHHHSSSVSLL